MKEFIETIGIYQFYFRVKFVGKAQSYSLNKLRALLEHWGLKLVICTGHTGWTDDFEFAFRHIDRVCNAWKKTQKPIDPHAPFDGYDEANNPEEQARSMCLPKAYQA